MADSTINGLTALAAASVTPGTDVAPVWQGSASTTKKVTIADLVTAGNTFGTIAASSPATITQTWNNVAVTFTGELINITDTASAAASLIQDWQVGGASKMQLRKDGALLISDGSATSPTIAALNQPTKGFHHVVSTDWWCLGSGNRDIAFGGSSFGGFYVRKEVGIGWSTTTDAYSGAAGAAFWQDANYIVAIRTGINASGFRVYNTYTDASNYQRASLDWTTNAGSFTISTAAAGTGTATAIYITAGLGLALSSGTGTVATLTGDAGLNLVSTQASVINVKTAATTRWTWNGTGHYQPATDNTYDLGTSVSAARVRNGYFNASVKVSSAASVLEVWNTDAAVSTVNYEKGVFDWVTTANTLTIGTAAAGTGTVRAINFVTGGTTALSISSAQVVSTANGLTITGASALIDATAGGLGIRATNAAAGISFSTGGTTIRWGISSAGVFAPNADNTYDFGSSINAGRVRNGYFNASVKVSSAASVIEAWNTDAATSTVNYEKGVFDWATTANTLTIGSAKGGTGVSRAVNFIAGGVTAMTLGTAGDVQIPKTVTATGTTGAQTINKQSGTVNFAAAATSLVVTNSFVTTSSVITATVGTADTTMKTVSVVAAAGSFTLFANAAATAETRVNFHVLN